MKEFIRKWFLSSVVAVVALLGWKYPFLGFSVPVVMIAALIFGLFRNRYFCGNLCPRGAFFDHWVSPLSRKKPIPRFLLSAGFRVSILIFLMGFMVFRLVMAKDSASIGHVFWLMCTVTTLIALWLGLRIHPRTWCSFCPIGTMQKILSRKKVFLTLQVEKCKSCRICEKKCPFQLSLIERAKEGKEIDSSDCLRCKKCIHSCPVKALQEKKKTFIS